MSAATVTADVCSIDGCERTTLARGWCQAHYLRWYRHGDPLGGAPERNRGTKAEQFWAKVDKDGPVSVHRPDLGPCWLWTGARTPEGYGRINIDRRPVPAHRFGYELQVGPIPDGLTIDHLCVNPSCVRGSHLEPVTNHENILRSTSPSAKHARKAHCPAGHPYEGDNVYVDSQGRRRCATCRPSSRAGQGGGRR